MQWKKSERSGSAPRREPETVLRVTGLKVDFHLPRGVVRAVDGVSLQVSRGRITALVGESGCGKTVTAMSVMGLLDGTGRIAAGEIMVNGVNVRQLTARQRTRYCGVQAGMIFQEPVDSLNPLFTIGELVSESILAHRQMSNRQSRKEAVELLARMKLPDPESMMGKYPFQLSGGMCQRVMIAMAMAMQPPLLIADEPTTALDVTVQSQILGQIRDMSSRAGTGVLLITHDLGVVAEVADDVYIMRAGQIVESGTGLEVFETPRHEYTRQLLAAIL
ncbi:MAG: ABC-type dipeptide/oligopeptide/nickel transport system, ATPase component [Sporomusa sp.]|nr:ABC-type dipeptide/oligopeptide/nickel transport system, ATPase component [Sporomusa sp.]